MVIALDRKRLAATARPFHIVPPSSWRSGLKPFEGGTSGASEIALLFASRLMRLRANSYITPNDYSSERLLVPKVPCPVPCSRNKPNLLQLHDAARKHNRRKSIGAVGAVRS